MDLSDPIRSVIPCLHGPVLAALARTTAPMRLTEVQRRVGDASVAGVRKVLLALVHHGIAHRVPGGYVLNRDHLAAGPIIALATQHGVLADRLRGWLDGRSEPVVAAGLFGSAARRDGGPDSDIDVLIVVEDGEEDHVALADDLADVLERWTGNRGHVHVLTERQHAELIAADAPLTASWAEELQPLVGARSRLVPTVVDA